MLPRLLLLSAALSAARASAQADWPAQLAIDVDTQSWDAAARVGAALVDEIRFGRMFPRFSDVPAEIRTRNLYADALDHTGNPGGARRQRSIARLLADPSTGGPAIDAPEIAAETARRLDRLKADLLATEIREPAAFPRSGSALIVAFWADWCAPCKPELERLSRYKNPRAKILTVDADHLDSTLQPYLRRESLQAPDLPQLYVVDPAGNIRFHTTGFDNDRFFEKKLDWMIEAALKSQP